MMKGWINTVFTLAIIATSLTATGRAQVKSVAAGAAVPAISRKMLEVQKLSGFTGKWITAESSEWNDWSGGGETTGSSIVEFGPDGLSIVELHESAPLFDPYHAPQTTTWDSASGSYHRNRIGPGGKWRVDEVCGWNASEFLCTGTATAFGKELSITTTYRAITPDSFTQVTEFRSNDGKIRHFITVRYKRAR